MHIVRTNFENMLQTYFPDHVIFVEHISSRFQTDRKWISFILLTSFVHFWSRSPTYKSLKWTTILIFIISTLQKSTSCKIKSADEGGRIVYISLVCKINIVNMVIIAQFVIHVGLYPLSSKLGSPSPRLDPASRVFFLPLDIYGN